MSSGNRTNKELLEEVLTTVNEVKTSHYELKETVGRMDICLRGSEYGENGIVHQVQQNTKCIAVMKRKQNRIVAWGTMLIAILNAGFFALIAFLKK